MRFILAAYRKWGEKCPKHLLGDFAFAIWEEEKEQIFCARDHVGVKPFYYFVNDDLFVFTNVLKPIVSHPNVPKKPDAASLSRYLEIEGFQTEKTTFIKDVIKLPPASIIVVSARGISQSIYWNPDEIGPIRYDTEQEYINHFRTLLEKAVEARIRTRYPVAAHLSGGLDSSSVAVLAARKLKKRSKTLHTFNWAQKPDDMVWQNHSEWSYAERIADAEGMHHTSVSLTAEHLAGFYDAADLFNNDAGYYWEEYLVRDAAQKQNIRTILSGWGGDQLVSNDGYAYFSGLFWKGHFIRAVHKIFEEYRHQRHPVLQTLRRSIRELVYPLFYKYMNGYYKRRTFGGKAHLKYCQEAFAAVAKTVSVSEARFVPGVHGEQRYMLKEGSVQKRIERWSAAAMAKKVEYAYPLLDKRIAEFALAIPEELFSIRNGTTRSFFKESLKGLMEHDIIWSRKGNDFHANRKKLQLFKDSFRIWYEKNGTRYNSNDSEYINIDKLLSTLESYVAEGESGELDMTAIVESIILFHAKLK